MRTPSRLRLVAGEQRAGEQRRAPASAAVPGGGSAAGDVLVAGGETSSRKQMIEEMRGLLPRDTSFVEAGETWQVLALAAKSRMVIVTGDLRDVSASGLVRVLGRRHPLLPVIALRGKEHRLAPGDDVGVASL